MTVKIVTDSTADLPDELVKEMGITVVPVYVRFGEEVLRDRVDISEDEFYERLTHDPVHPNTTQPTPQDFVDVYQKLSADADGIVSIHLTGKLSGTCNSALMARETVGKECPIEVVDSETLSMALGLVVIAAATAAKAGESMDKIVEAAKQAMPKIRLLFLLDTLEYLKKGGRIGKAKALLGSILSVKPVLTIKDGELVPAGQVRTRAKGMDKLFEFVKEVADIQDLAVVYNTTPDEAQALAERIGSVFDKEKIRMARLGPGLGVHGGPGAMVVAIRGA
ncbi:MAG: DegV family EDD domain-containing protein [Dehalococcoidia bacterium]|nr:DegV family EDD domain-containing protein [Dehalococcoidia bacterium]